MDTNTLRVITASAKTGGTDSWETPKELFEKLNEAYAFTLDPCASQTNHKCAKYFTKEQDGLTKSWKGHSVFVNPPYSQASVWLKKCYEENKMHNGCVVVLIPARTDTKYWHDYCMKASVIYLIKGRLKFEIDGKPILDKNGRPSPAPFPSSIILFNDASTRDPKVCTMTTKGELIYD